LPSGASSIPLCYIPFPATLLHQPFFHPPSLNLAIYFLVFLLVLLIPNSYTILTCWVLMVWKLIKHGSNFIFNLPLFITRMLSLFWYYDTMWVCCQCLWKQYSLWSPGSKADI
jgi:hypothetical protein